MDPYITLTANIWCDRFYPIKVSNFSVKGLNMNFIQDNSCQLLRRESSNFDLKLIIILLLILLLFMSVGKISFSKGEDIGAFKGKKPFDFSLIDTNGKIVSLYKCLAEKKVVIINFWFKACPPCRVEMPDFQKLYNEREKKGIIFLSINVGDKLKVVKNFLTEKHYTFPVLLDTESKVSKKYLVHFMPQTFIIGRDSIIKERIWGQTNYVKITSLLE